jgi:hypothetical protein
LNRDKKGFRVKTLRDNGYNTVADIEKSTSSSLSRISGISPEAAIAIKRESSKIAKLSRESVHIRLSTDDKSSAATALVSAISKYLNLAPTAEACKQLSDRKKEILAAVKESSPLASGLKWFFASKNKKAKAEESPQKISRFMAVSFAIIGLYTAYLFIDPITVVLTPATGGNFFNNHVLPLIYPLIYGGFMVLSAVLFSDALSSYYKYRILAPRGKKEKP